MIRTLFAMALITAVTLTGPLWLPLVTSHAQTSFILSPGFTALAIAGAVLVTVSPVLAIAYMIHDARPAGRSEPEGGK